ncbi:hypothetical protein B0H11DRAFT_2223959 [Mycena galericulata]|nr:hypothetical protein B0H11DRAFT_2223959 [Mycena galericulata]
MAHPTSSTTNGSSPVRLLSDPNFTTCPDFVSDAYDDIRDTIDADSAVALAKLTAAWTKGNDKDKAQWILQTEADRVAEEAGEARLQQEADKAAADAAKAAEEDRLEAEKKKPKLGEFNAKSGPSSSVQARISAFAQKKLEKREYCPLWPFTPAGINEAAKATLSSADDASPVSFGRTQDNQLTIQTGSNVHKNMRKDEDLSEHEFHIGWHRYVKELGRAKWPKIHVDALANFFFALESHPMTEKDHGGQIVRIYADRYRQDWFATLGTDESFNIGLISDEGLKDIRDEYFMNLHTKTLSA